MDIHLDDKHVLLERSFVTRQQVVEAIGEVFTRCGDATARYVEGMRRKEEEFSSWLTNGIALPHGTSDVRGEVLRSAVVVVQIPEGVDWGQGRTVHLAIGLAGKGDEQHLQLLGRLARVLQDVQAVARLSQTRDSKEVLSILANGGERSP